MSHPAFLAAFTAGDALRLIGETTFFGKIIILTLLVISVLSWAVMIEKARLLYRIRRSHALFWTRCRAWLDGRLTWTELRRWALDQPKSPLGNLLVAMEGQTSAVGVRRTAERVIYGEVESMERYLMLLSTAVSVSPFLGLMGTVWGIMAAFWDMASQRSASLLVVAPGIAEALITTVGGLGAAIPAVVFYNLFVRKIDLVANELERLRSLLEERVTAPPSAPPAEPVHAGADARRPETHDKERIR